MYKGDNAPVGNTCPLINKIEEVLTETHDELDSIISDLDGYIHSDYIQRMNNLLKKLRPSYGDRNSPLEKIRSANSELRDWGNEMCNKFTETESEKEYYEKKVSELEDQIDSYKDEIKDLESQVSELS